MVSNLARGRGVDGDGPGPVACRSRADHARENPRDRGLLALRAEREVDAVLLGAVGGPKWDDPAAKVRPEQGLLGIRKELGLYANLRPVSVHPKLAGASPLRPELLVGVDLLVVRELTGGIYFGEKKKEAERAVDTCVYTADEVRRVVRRAATFAAARRGKL